MRSVTVLILLPRASASPDSPGGWLDAARLAVAERHREMFLGLGAMDVRMAREPPGVRSFGRRLRELVADVIDAAPSRRATGLVVLGGGSMPLARPGDVHAFLAAARGRPRRALANNVYSADAIAVPDARMLLDVPDLPSDNALPRWLAEHAGIAVADLRDRPWLAFDIDSPLDVLLLGRDRGCPSELAGLAENIAAANQPVAKTLDAVAATLNDRRAELLIAGRTSSRTLQWLERNATCRVRALVEERGLKASTALALGGGDTRAGTRGDTRGGTRGGDTRAGTRGGTIAGTAGDQPADDPPSEPDRGESANVRFRPPRSAIGLLLDDRGPGALGEMAAELGDAAVIDTRVLLAHRLGADESRWPPLADRLASDLLRVEEVADPWLRDLTASAAGARIPILLGGHSLVGPGVPLLHTSRTDTAAAD